MLVVVASSFYGTGASAQSAVFAYKNMAAARSDFMSVRGLPNQADAEFLAKQKLIELINDDKHLLRLAASNQKGYGAVVSATVTVAGKPMNVYGAALGQSSQVVAEQQALANLRQQNPEWTSGPHTVVQRFQE